MPSHPPGPVPTLITHAGPLGPRCRQALANLALPRLQALLQQLAPTAQHGCEADSLSPLHERLQAQALGLPAQDGLLPWAALQARALGLQPAVADAGWAWLTPCHWQVQADHVRMADPADCPISATESGQVMQAMADFSAEYGVQLHGLHQGNWLASSRWFQDLPTAALARAAGGAVDHWLPRQPQAQVLRRLQNEMQMLLYTHALNDARSARGLLPINSFWISATGSLPQDFAPQPLDLHAGLRAANRADDAQAWVQAWQALDSQVFAPLLEQARAGAEVRLTLCGETTAQSFANPHPTGWARLRQRLLRGHPRTSLAALLQGLN